MLVSGGGPYGQCCAVTEGSVRIATIHTLSYYFVADVIAHFLEVRVAA